MAPVAIIDLGSNSIKLLVATRAPGGGVQPLKLRTLDARIGAGISHARPVLGEAGMEAAISAIQTLLREAEAYNCDRHVLVATSAVRDAGNGPEFARRVQAATGFPLRILTGEEEANLIGRGLTADPALTTWEDFYVFDLGGGSLECLAFRGRRMEQAVSLQLGCVRLTEQFVPDPAAPFPVAAVPKIQEFIQGTLASAGFAFSLPATAAAIGTGGTVTTARAILGAAAGRVFDQSNPVISTAQLRALFDWVARLTLDERRHIPGLPPGRADVFPIAVLTLLTVAEAGALASFRNSLCNLRHGLAAEILG